MANGSLVAVNTPNQGDLIADQFGAETGFVASGGKWDGSNLSHHPTARVSRFGLTEAVWS